MLLSTGGDPAEAQRDLVSGHSDHGTHARDTAVCRTLSWGLLNLQPFVVHSSPVRKELGSRSAYSWGN